MELDDEICLCFHVTKRKIINFIRIEKPRRAGELSECFGAGTGCGWCRTYLRRYFEATQATSADAPAELSKDDYERQRARYVRSGGGTPAPGATPLPEDSP